MAKRVGKDPGMAEFEDGIERLGEGNFGVGEILQGVGSVVLGRLVTTRPVRDWFRSDFTRVVSHVAGCEVNCRTNMNQFDCASGCARGFC